MTGWKEEAEGWKSAENTDWYKEKQAEDKKIEAEREVFKMTEAQSIIREAIEDYVCNYLTDTKKAQTTLNALRDMEQEIDAIVNKSQSLVKESEK